MRRKRKRLPAAPADLSQKAKQWWRRLHSEFELTDAPALLILEQGLRSFDRAERARRELDRDGVTMVDRYGQKKPHPAFAAERDSRAATLSAFKMLSLTVDPPGERGRPAGK